MARAGPVPVCAASTALPAYGVPVSPGGCSATARSALLHDRNRNREGQAVLKVILWIIAFIFIVGLLVIFGILDLIF